MTACPRCGGVLELVVDGSIGLRPAPFLSCSSCEFCEEVTTTSDVERTVEDAQRFHLITRQPLRVICSWCPDAREQTRAAAEAGERITHGMCPTCSARINAEMDAEARA